MLEPVRGAAGVLGAELQCAAGRLALVVDGAAVILQAHDRGVTVAVQLAPADLAGLARLTRQALRAARRPGDDHTADQGCPIQK